MSLSINFPSGFLPSVLGLCATLLAYFVSPVSSSLLNYSLLLFLSFSLSFHRNFAISFVSSVSCTCGSINSASLVTSYDRDVSAVSTLQGVQTRCLLFHVSLQFANFRPSPMPFFPSVPFFYIFSFWSYLYFDFTSLYQLPIRFSSFCSRSVCYLTCLFCVARTIFLS